MSKKNCWTTGESRGLFLLQESIRTNLFKCIGESVQIANQIAVGVMGGSSGDGSGKVWSVKLCCMFCLLDRFPADYTEVRSYAVNNITNRQ